MFTFIDRCAYRLTSLPFLFNPLQKSPPHRSQNKRSVFFNSVGFLPSRFAPGMSFFPEYNWSRTCVRMRQRHVEIILYPHAPRSFSFRGFPEPSAIINSVYWRDPSCLREQINCSRTEYSIFLKEKVYPMSATDKWSKSFGPWSY